MTRRIRSGLDPAPGTGARQRPVRTATFLVSMGLTAICVFIVLIIAVLNTPTDKFGIWARVLVILILLVFMISSLATTEVIPWRSRSWRDWRRPKVLGTVVYLFLSAAGFVVGISTIFSPSPGDQKTQLAIGSRVDSIGQDTKQILDRQKALSETFGVGARSVIDLKLKDFWGEPGCAVTYKFTRKDGALRIDRSKQRTQTKLKLWRFTIESKPDTPSAGPMRTSTATGIEREGFRPGQAVTFVYKTDGASEFLDWMGASPEQPVLTLVPCPKEA